MVYSPPPFYPGADMRGGGSTPPIYVPNIPGTNKPTGPGPRPLPGNQNIPQGPPPIYPDVPQVPQGPQGTPWDADASAEWFRQWRDRRNSIQRPGNAGASTLPPPQLRNGRGALPPGQPPWGRGSFDGSKGTDEGPVIRDHAIRSAPQGPQTGPGVQRVGYPPDGGQFMQSPNMPQGNPNQQPQLSQQLPQEDQMPAWMRARLRRNPGGGGQLGGGMQFLTGGGPQPTPDRVRELQRAQRQMNRQMQQDQGAMQSMPVGAPQPAPQMTPDVAAQYGAMMQGRGQSFGRPPINQDQFQNPYYGGFDFMF